MALANNTKIRRVAQEARRVFPRTATAEVSPCFCSRISVKMPLPRDSLKLYLSARLTLLKCCKLCITETQVIALGSAYFQALPYERDGLHSSETVTTLQTEGKAVPVHAMEV
jgi:hypothetical protein